MNNAKQAINAFRDHSPKHVQDYEELCRMSGTQDPVLLASYATMVCMEHRLNVDIRNPFPAGTPERDAWASWFDPKVDVVVEDPPAKEKPKKSGIIKKLIGGRKSKPKAKAKPKTESKPKAKRSATKKTTRAKPKK